MMRLSDHFTLLEFTRSDNAARLNIDNAPPLAIEQNLVKLAGLMEQVRALLGGHAIGISSGYRCSSLNKAIGSRPSSKHVQGLACDFRCDDYGSPVEIVKTIQSSQIEFDQCILEFFNPVNGNGWVHIGLGRDMRRQVLTINSHGTFSGVRL